MINKITEQLDGEEKIHWQNLITTLRRLNHVVVAFSGGIDSAFLAVAAWLALQDKMLAITLHSPIHIDEDDNAAKAVASQFGFPFKTIFYNDLESSLFTDNPTNRCYHCKLARFSKLKEFAIQQGYPVVIEGSNADDLKDYRPGAKASKELEVRSPLQEVGYTKAKIRKVSRMLGISVWDRPSSPCLAKRIPFGTPIKLEDLQTVAKAEEFLKSNGFINVRVRYQAPVARIEVHPDQIERLVQQRNPIINHFQTLGIQRVLLDLEGYRSGKLNEEVKK